MKRVDRFDVIVLAIVAVLFIAGTCVWLRCEAHCYNEEVPSWATFTAEGCYCMPIPEGPPPP
jgi:hypothetical protein